MGKYLYQAIMSPDEEGGYVVAFPDLPGCVSEGDTFTEAVTQAADAAQTYVASLLAHGDSVPRPTKVDCPEGAESVLIFFEATPDYLVTGEVVSAAEAARRLGLSPGRITHMLDAGILEGYREGRRTWITVESIEARQAVPVAAGRPKKVLMA